MKFTPVDHALYQPCEKAGTLQRVWYDAKTCSEGDEPLRKDALVYLPYGYEDEPNRTYPVMFLMHGGGGDSNEFFGGVEAKSPLKNMLDNVIASGYAEPLIVVAPTYMIAGREQARQSIDVASELTHRFPQELMADLIPFLDSNFRTIPDRQHRAFGGFSMGGETTWSVMSDALKDVAWYLPLSGDYWAIALKGGKDYPVETADALIAKIQATGVAPGDYHVIACTGDKDIAYEALDPMVAELGKRAPWFTPAETPDQGTLCYLLKKDGWHTYDDCYEYIWHVLPWLFKN